MTDHGLEAILIDADTDGWSAEKLAANVLAECCVEDGKFNNFQVGLLAVMTFLSEQFRQPPSVEQAYRDLLLVLNGGGSIDAISRWLESNFG